MTQQKESVVTPERFESGLTYAGLPEPHPAQPREIRLQLRADGHRQGRRSCFEAVALQRPGGAARVLALGEDWCPDVFRGLPVMARIAEAAGMELRVFPRDDNLDIMNEFLNHGESQSIPTFVFYTSDHRYIAHWIERPAKANAEMGEVMKRYEGLDRSKPDDVAKLRQIANEFQTGPHLGELARGDRPRDPRATRAEDVADKPRCASTYRAIWRSTREAAKAAALSRYRDYRRRSTADTGRGRNDNDRAAQAQRATTQLASAIGWTSACCRCCCRCSTRRRCGGSGAAGRRRGRARRGDALAAGDGVGVC